MTSPVHIIYIPGLGDHNDSFRQACLATWRWWGITAELVPITWYDGADFATKYELVQKAIFRANRTNNRIVLVGESAGASLALHAGAKEPQVTRVITLCGVARREAPISPRLSIRTPALKEAVHTLPLELPIPIHSVRAAFDNVVNARYSIARGASKHVVWVVGHLATIILCLTILAPFIVSLAKREG